MTERPNRLSLESLLSYLILLGGLATIVVSARMVRNSYSLLFFWDSWEMILAATRGEELLSWHWLWAQHNEHRLLIPKLLEVADLYFFQGRQWFLLCLIFLTQCFHLALLGFSMRALGGIRRIPWRVGLGMAAFCLFCPSQWENLTWGFQLCFVLPLFFATFSFVTLLLAWKRQVSRMPGLQPLLLTISIASAIGATWSLANGILLWPLLVVAAFLLISRAAALAYSVVGIASIATYMYHFVPGTEGGGALAALNAPLRLITYIAVYIGSAWIRQDVRLSIVSGVAGIAVAGVLMLRVPRYIAEGCAFSVQMLLTIAFCLATSVMTAVGRVNLGLEQALAPRYQSLILIFWWALGALIVLPWLGETQSRARTVALEALLILVLLRGALFFTRPLHDVMYRKFITDHATAALLMNVNDPEALRNVYPNAERVWNGAQYLRSNHLSIFTDKIGVDKPLDSVFGSASSSECMGSPDLEIQSGKLPGIVTISGWAWNTRDRRPVDTIIAASNGMINGRFAVGAWLPKVRASHPGINNSFVGFAGYVRPGNSPAKITLYAILPGRPERACLLATVDSPNPVQVVSPRPE